MIFAGCKIVNRDLDRFEVDWAIVDRYLAFGEVVIEIAIAQIERMIGGGHPRGIRIPIQQIERERRLSLQVIVDHVWPQQIVRT